MSRRVLRWAAQELEQVRARALVPAGTASSAATAPHHTAPTAVTAPITVTVPAATATIATAVKLTVEGHATVRRPRKSTTRAKQRGSVVSALPVRERDVLRAVLAALRAHPAVAWVVRLNSGTFVVDGRYIKAGFRGCPDLWGQMNDGRLMVCEVKRPS